ncbi:MFS transporter [Streptomyces sp. DH12]|uniref:MFS transporter n=1 Tax=Streptomyces sp. DH12 TaxID=2857010 RepID=UPI001E404B5E|nr:MFS transporter [Streptomyces sp. DH12]
MTRPDLTEQDPAGPPAGPPVPSLWRHRDFTAYWLGESAARVGVQVTALVLPLLAVVELDATSSQAGLLNGAQFVPYLLFTLVAGVWVDRLRPRPFLVATNLARAALLTLVPVLLWLDVLGLGLLYATGFAIGVLAVLYDLSSSTYLPVLIGKDRLAEGNSRVQGSGSVARIAGPGLGGVLVQLVSLPATMVVAAGVHLFSAVALLAVRTREERPAPTGKPVLREIASALRFVAGNPYLRVSAFRAGFNNLFFMAMQTLLPLFVVRELGRSSGTLGLVLAVGAVGSLIGAVLAVGVARRFGPGRAIVAGFGVGSFAQALTPLAGGPTVVVLTVLLGSFLLGGIGTTIGNIHLSTLTQTVTPARMLGRTNAALRFLTWGTMPVGAVAGGWLGDAVGLRAALVVTAVGFAVSLLLVAFSPVGRLRELPPEASWTE